MGLVSLRTGIGKRSAISLYADIVVIFLLLLILYGVLFVGLVISWLFLSVIILVSTVIGLTLMVLSIWRKE